jgi:23S rRNA (pseudouridine1915-N3)-methyltransferase
MHLRLIAVGNKMPDWIDKGYHEYAKRLAAGYQLSLIEIPPEKRTKQTDISRALVKEGKKMLAASPLGNLVIALDVKGQVWSTEKLAENMQVWHRENRTVDFFVGGPEGLADACLQKAQIKLSLSALTLPHPLVRVIVAEQLYRSYSILQNHPYHRP